MGRCQAPSIWATPSAQVKTLTMCRAVMVCKTVGSAYVGSNPTPATTCENGPLPGNSRLRGPFFSVPWCVTLSRCRPSCRGVHGRMADGIRAPERSVRTVGCFTDGHGRAALAAFPGLTGARDPRAWIPGCAPGPRDCPGPQGGRAGRYADGWAGGAGEHGACRAGGWSGRGSPVRLRAAGRSRSPVRGYGCLAGEVSAGSVRHGGPGAPGERGTVGRSGRQYGPGGDH